jgi:ATP-dependent Clp protease adaptor protein ClpS
VSETPVKPAAPVKRRPAKPAPRSRPETKDKPKTDQAKQWNVVLLDDDQHSYEYVMAMVQELFAHPLEKSYQIAKAVDTQGRAICLTTHKEHAELKRDQILAFGKDPLIASCKGSMSAIIEPADFGDDDAGGKDPGGKDPGGEDRR